MISTSSLSQGNHLNGNFKVNHGESRYHNFPLAGKSLEWKRLYGEQLF